MAKFPFKTLLFFIPKRTFSASPSAPAPSFTVKYLVESCGLSSKSALSASQKLQLKEENIQRTESLLNLLKSHGFDDTGIAKIIVKRPKILLSKVDTIEPKLEFLGQNGIAGELLIKHSFILCRSLRSHIKPSIEFLWEILKTKKRVVSAVNTARMFPFRCNLRDAMQPNIDLLKKEGVPDVRIANFLAYRACTMLQTVDRFAHLVNSVKELGVHPYDPTFLYAIHVKSAMSDSVWEKKVQIFENWGLSEEEIVSTFRRYPFLFGCSEKNLMNTMDFYVNTVKLKPEAVTAYPLILTLSVDNRIRPRHSVYKVLIKEKLLYKTVKLSSLLLCNEKLFLERYVAKHSVVVPNLMDIYNTSKNSSISS